MTGASDDTDDSNAKAGEEATRESKPESNATPDRRRSDPSKTDRRPNEDERTTPSDPDVERDVGVEADTGATSYQRVYRWIGGMSVSAILVTVALVFGKPTFLVTAFVPVAYVVYGAVTTPPHIESLEFERRVSTDSPAPGEPVTVELEVTNTGESAIPDLRLIDGVPEELAVVKGTPRAAITVAAGRSATVEYTLIARRGTYTYRAVKARARNLSGSGVATASIEPDGTTELTCTLDVEEFPLEDRTIQFAGPLATDSGGPGVEFYSTREYRRGDPMSRIDWRKLAKTGELTTIEYREHRAARVVVVIDAREPTRVAAGNGLPTGAEFATYAAARAVSALDDAGHEVGVAALGIEDPVLDIRPAWVEPGTGAEFRTRAQSVYDAAMTADPASTDGGRGGDFVDAPAWPGTTGRSAESGSSVGTDGGDRELERLLGWLSADAQLLFVTPLLDEFPVEAVETLLAYNHPVTVLTPDAVGEQSLGQHLARIDRAIHLARLRRVGAPVIDWDRETPLQLALAAAIERGVASR